MGLDISKIDTIVFDLGGVIIDLHLNRTYQAFAQLGEMSVEEVRRFAAEKEFFKLYETGKIDDPTFRAHLREELEFKGDEALLDEAWNAMLGPIALKKFELLEKLSAKYKLLVLSNTNEIHMKRILRIANHISPKKDFYEYFDKVYLSNEIGERKPDATIYEYIIDDGALTAERTLFIDDLLENVVAARSLGIQAHHLKDETIVDLLNESI